MTNLPQDLRTVVVAVVRPRSADVDILMALEHHGVMPSSERGYKEVELREVY